MAREFCDYLPAAKIQEAILGKVIGASKSKLRSAPGLLRTIFTDWIKTGVLELRTLGPKHTPSPPAQPAAARVYHVADPDDVPLKAQTKSEKERLRAEIIANRNRQKSTEGTDHAIAG